MDLSNNALFKMKSYEYLEKIAEAMKTNTHCTELILKSNDITNARNSVFSTRAEERVRLVHF